MPRFQRFAPAALWQAALASVVFVAFAGLALRHVGESVFLADQTDQLQLFEQLIRFEPAGFLGPVASGPPPPVRSTGPLGAVLFGLTLRAGAGVDAVHGITSLLLVVTTAVAFAALFTTSRPFAWTWLVLFLANPIVWWNAGTLWVNTLLLPAGNILLACMVLCLRTPSITRMLSMPIVVLFALQVSLAAITAFAPVALVAARVWRAARARPPLPVAVGVLALLFALAAGPYLIGEAMTGFSNTRALVMRGGAPSPEQVSRIAYAFSVVRTVVDPVWMMRGETGTPRSYVVAGAAVAALSLLVAGLGLRRAARVRAESSSSGHDNRRRAANTIFWLVVTAVVAVAAQMAFFALQRRDVLSYHYVSMLLPLYALPPAALVAWLVELAPRTFTNVVTAGLAAGCAAMLLWRGPMWADRYSSSTEWSFAQIARAVEGLCEGGAAGAREGAGFVSLMPGHDGVLTYLMTRSLVNCRHQAGGDRLVAASVDRSHPPVVHEDGVTYALVKVVEPGIALYQRQRDGSP